MRTLSRPMFNMGGPIKQGIMHGIREPHNSGGRIGFNVGGGINAAKWLASIAGKTFRKVGANYNLGKIGGPGGTGWSTIPRSSVGKEIMTVPKPGWGARIAEKWKGMPSWFKSSVERDPLARLGKAAWEGKGLLGTPIKWAGKQLATPTGVLGLMYVGGRWLTSDGTPATDDQIKQHKAQHGPFDHTGKKKTKEAQAKFAAAQRDTRVQKYLDLMGYDRAKKTAIADALIDASKLVSDRGTLDRKNITGELINPAIQALSKRLDKPDQIREAVGLMMVKGEIQKDLEDPQVKKLRALQIEKGEQELGENFETDIRNLLLSRKDKVNKSTLERYARLTADKYGENFTKVEGEGDMSGDGIYMVEDTIIRVTDGVPERIV